MIVPTREIVFKQTGDWLARIAGYLSASVLLHAITVVELGLLLATFGIERHPFKGPALGILCLTALFTQLDARSRYQEYKKVRDQLIRHGPDRRIFRLVAASRCQRDAGLAAAKTLGHEAVCRNYFRSTGYRWYHLLPDFVCRHPMVLLSPTFLRATFFLPGYISRFPTGLRVVPGRLHNPSWQRSLP